MYGALLGIFVMGAVDDFTAPHSVKHSAAIRPSARQVIIPYDAGMSGWYVWGKIGATSIKFYIDTGSYDVGLRAETVASLGANIVLTNTKETDEIAVGTMEITKARVPKLQVGPIMLTNVDASILPPGGADDLLGLSFLNRLTSYGYRDGELVLEQ